MKHVYPLYGISIDRCAVNKTRLLAAALREAIEHRTLPPGKRLLSHQELSKASTLGINMIRSAYKELENQGYLTVIAGGGTIVSLELNYLDQKQEPKFTLESDLERTPARRIESVSGMQMDYLQIGQEGLNPAHILQHKPSTALNIINEELKKSSYEWMDYKQQERELKQVVQRKLVSDFNASFSLNEIALGGNRISVFVNLFKDVLKKGGLVVLSSNADRDVKELLDLHGLRLLFISSSEKGMCLNDLKSIIDFQRSIGDPVTCIYSNPYHDSFSNLEDIDLRREALYKAVSKWGVMLIEEYGQSEYLMPIDRVKWVDDGNHIRYKNVILIVNLSCLFSGMDEVNMVVASEKTVADFQSRAVGSSNTFSYTFGIYQRMIIEGVLEKHKKEILTKLDCWQIDLRGAAKHYLSRWFELKEGSCGTSFWLTARDEKIIRLPLRQMRTVDLAFRHSACEDGERVSVQGLRVCMGYGNNKRVKAVFKIMNRCLA